MQHPSAIPIANIYYLLCYAWDGLGASKVISVRPERSLSLADLFARVLTEGVSHLLRRGLRPGYVNREEQMAGVRGTLNVSATISVLAQQCNQTVCSSDDLQMDTAANRAIKAALARAAANKDLAPELRKRASALHKRLHGVKNISLSADTFRNIETYRADRVYSFVLNVCKLSVDNPFLEAGPGRARFVDFEGDTSELAHLFERFVFNFYAREQRLYRVARPIIPWHNAIGNTEHLKLLPRMRTDVVLSSSARRVILDTKYYADAFQRYYDVPKVRSDHLYQIMTYLQNDKVSQESQAEGMLLYPAIGHRFEMPFELSGYKVTVKSLDLNQHWQGIREDLLRLVNQANQERD
jgi:5-methylcytosine-specific restriction enzyme subunit McrC